MNGTAARFLRLGVSLSGLVVLGWVLTGQAAKSARHGIPLPTDWSHSHVIFSRPASAEQLASVSEDPRYWQQLHRREQSLVLSPEASDLTSVRFQAGSSAANDGLWSEDLGNLASAGAENYPAKFSFSSTTANCGSATTPDYVVYSTGKLGSGTQASVVAFDNLYTGCGGTVPTVYWAYNTGGQILTSPVLSLDGTQVAFAQTSGSPTGVAGLLLLKWKASASETVGSPGVPTSVTNALYPTCVAPCMTEVFLHDGNGVATDDRTSSPFYDYTNDIAWVGGGNGWLHKLTGVFKGTPTEVHGGGFPVQVQPNNPNTLSDPVYDHTSKNVFVGDEGGYLHRVASATGVTTTSGQLDWGAGLVESPILDQTNGLVYVFASSDGTALCPGGTACSAVYLLSTTFLGGTGGPKVTVGTSVVYGTLPNPSPMYIGGFDSTYYNKVGATGNLYVCGNTGAAPTLYRVPILSGAFDTLPLAVAVLTPAARTAACSPVTDFSNPNASGGKAEHLFFSVQNFGHPTACGPVPGKGCMMNFVDTPWQASTHYNVGQEILIRRAAATSQLYINVAIVAGTTAVTTPTWPGPAGNKTVDGGVTWLNQGRTTVTPLAGWVTANPYNLHDPIFDGTNVEIVTTAGTSAGAAPTWNTTVGGSTTDAGGVVWINAGPWPNAALVSNGGTGGIIIDNSVGSGTMAGASQVYFFTLGNQLCSTSGGTGGCAMQASQSTLQ